jgi:hypothetical protein
VRRARGGHRDADRGAVSGRRLDRARIARGAPRSRRDRTGRFFAGRPFAEQFAIQAQGERVGILTWRAFARDEPDARRRDVLLACAPLEEESALVLESILFAG